MCISVYVCLSARISPEQRARSLPFLCMLPMSVSRSSSCISTIGRIACRQERGDRSAQRGRSVIYDCFVHLELTLAWSHSMVEVMYGKKEEGKYFQLRIHVMRQDKKRSNNNRTEFETVNK